MSTTADTTSPLNYAQLMERLTDASVVPDVDEEDDEGEEEETDPAKLYLGHLEQIAQIIRTAEGAKAAEGISSEEWLAFLNSADETISTLCSEVYDSSYTDCIGVYAAPTSEGQYVRTERALPINTAGLVGLEKLGGPSFQAVAFLHSS